MANMFERSSHHATYNFNQEGTTLYRNQPRFPFEYYIDIKLNKVGTASSYVQKFFNTQEWVQIAPLVKSVSMPSFKIITTPLNQYNRKRLSQTRIMYEPVRMVLHDVADGKTLSFWEMYYRYYFMDGNEPGMNVAKQPQTAGTDLATQYSVENFLNNYGNTGSLYGLNLQSTATSKVDSYSATSGIVPMPYDTVGNKQDTDNIVTDKLSNHGFGFNLPTVGKERDLIKLINIYQVHAGKFNQVALVNPRISEFKHDVLDYAESGKTLELTFMIEYEYAYYIIQNMELGGKESNNTSTISQYTHGDFLDLPASAFNVGIDFIQPPSISSISQIPSQQIQNMQSSISSVMQANTNSTTPVSSTSALAGILKTNPAPYNSPAVSNTVVQNFNFNSQGSTSSSYPSGLNQTLV